MRLIGELALALAIIGTLWACNGTRSRAPCFGHFDQEILGLPCER